MAGYTIEVTVSAGDLDFTMPAINVGTYNATIYWGDTTQSTITAYNDADLAHTYASAGTYEIEITGTFPAPCFRNTGDTAKVTDVITWGDSADYDGFENMYGLFDGCSNLASFGSGAIQVDTVVDMTFAFINCSSLSDTITTALMANCSGFTSLAYAFRNTAITAIQAGAFDGFTSVTTCDNSFMFMYDLGAIPAGMLQDVAVSCNNFNRLFRDSGMDSVADVFYDDGDQDTVFLNRSPNFTTAFQGAGGGLLPDLWRCDYGTGTPTTTDCFNNADSCLNYKNVPVAWGGDAVSDPAITDVDTDDTITVGQTGATVTGTDFLPYQYDGTIYLSDNATWGLGTIVEQTPTSWGDTGLEFTVVQGGLSTGTVYLYVETDRDDYNAVGYAVTLQSGVSDNPFTAASSMPVPTAAASFDQVNPITAAASMPVPQSSVSFSNAPSNDFTAAAAMPVLEASASFDQENSFGVTAGLPVPEASAQFDQENLFGVTAGLPVPEASAQFDQGNLFGVTAGLPVLSAAAVFNQENPMTVAGNMPVPVADALFDNLPGNNFYASPDLPVPSALVSFEQISTLVVAGLLPVPQALAQFDQVNPMTVAGVLPVLQSSASFSNILVNELTAQSLMPVITSTAQFEQANAFLAESGLPVLTSTAQFANAVEVYVSSILRFFPMLTATLRTAGDRTNVDGEWVTGATTDTDIRIRPLQPAVGKELLWLPEGDRARAHMYTWTTDNVSIYDEGAPGDPDKIIHNGRVYLVAMAGHWERDDHLELLIRLLPGESP